MKVFNDQQAYQSNEEKNYSNLVQNFSFLFNQQKNRTLYRHDEPLDVVLPWEKGIGSFYEWLQESFPDGVILVAHNAFAGKAEQIINDLRKSRWSDVQIEDAVKGFCDTLQAFPKHFPGLKSFSSLARSDGLVVKADGS
jgi:hypothetical protein